MAQQLEEFTPPERGLDHKMFRIDAVMIGNGQKVPYAYAFTISAASLIAQAFRSTHIHGKLKPVVSDFTVSEVRVPEFSEDQ